MSAFGKFYVGMFQMSGFTASGNDIWEPATDLVETDGGLVVFMELAGVRPEDFEITLEGNNLTVRGIRRTFCPECRRSYLNMEMRHGLFNRTIRLPIRVTERGARTRLSNGILEIFLPRNDSLDMAMGSIEIAIDI